MSTFHEGFSSFENPQNHQFSLWIIMEISIFRPCLFTGHGKWCRNEYRSWYCTSL